MVESIFVYDDKPSKQPFDYINKDLDLLFLLIFIEAFKSGKDEINFGDFFKGDYWDVEQVSEEIFDTNDYFSIPDMVIEQVLFIFEDIRIRKVIEVGIDNTDDAVDDLLVTVAKIGPEESKTAPNYRPSFEQLYFLSSQEAEQRTARIEKDPSTFNRDEWRITKEQYDKKLQEIMDRLQSLGLELEEHSKADYDYQTTVATVLSVARRAKDIFDSSETHEKRAFINYLIQNPTVADKELVFDLRKPFDLVLNFTDEQRKTVTISDNRPSWLRGWGSNPRPRD